MPQNALSSRNVRVFVSSTYTDLIPVRDAAKATIERLRGAEFVGMELFGARSESAEHVSIEEVDDADLYIGLVGGRWGSGITEAEYRRAREKKIQCLLYLMNEEAITVRDAEAAKQARLAHWRRELSDSFDGHLVQHFSTPDDLAKAIPIDLHNWLYRRLVKDAQRSAADGQLSLLRALAQSVREPESLREALIESGIAVGDDLLETLVALSPMTTKLLVAGINDLPNSYATRVENFITAYLGTPGNPVPFGGRADFMQRLDSWLTSDDVPPYLLIAEEAGRGKSAALVRWSRTVMSDERYAVVFVPVSIRYHTNLAGVFFAALAARLARVCGQPLTNETNTSAEVWRGLVAEYLKKPLEDGRTLVVVIDGLDEAADWVPGPDLFPFTPGERVRLVVSARFTNKAPTREAWRNQLGWDSNLSTSFELLPLTKEGVRDVVVRMGFPLAELGDKVDIVAQLHRLSEGDPLLVNLYVKELWKKGDAAARLTPEDLAKIEPGLAGYFKQWWDDQRALWGSDAPLKEPGVRAVLNLLSCALGPLRREDVIALAPPDCHIGVWTLDDFIRPIERFVIEEEDGLIFNHPRFAQHHYAELKGEAAVIEKLFVAWGKRELARLTSGELSPLDVAPYLIQYYAHHLERTRAPVDDLMALLVPEWRQAWERQDGGLSGLLADVHRAWNAVAAEDDRLIKRGAAPVRLADEIYCALCSASIRSLAENIPPPLMKRLLEEKIWSPQQALAYARNTIDTDRKGVSLIIAAQFLEPAERRLAVEEAIAVARESESGEIWSQLLLSIPEFTVEELLTEPNAMRAAGLVALRLAGAGRFPDAMRIVRALSDPAPVAQMLVKSMLRQEEVWQLADLLPPGSEKMIAVALSAAMNEPIAESVIESFGEEAPNIRRLIALAGDDSLPLTEGDRFSVSLLVAAMNDYPNVLHLLRSFARRTPQALLRSFVAEQAPPDLYRFLTAADDELPKSVASLFTSMPSIQAARVLAPLLRGPAIDAILRIRTNGAVLAALAPIASSNGEFEKVWTVASSAPAASRLEVLSAIIPHLDEERRAVVVPELLALVRNSSVPAAIDLDFSDDSPVGESLGEIAPFLNSAQLLEALEIANRIGDTEWRGLVAAIVNISPDTFATFVDRYAGKQVVERGAEFSLIAVFAREMRLPAIRAILQQIKTGQLPPDRIDLIDGFTLIAEDPIEGEQVRLEVWKWAVENQVRFNLSEMATPVPAELESHEAIRTLAAEIGTDPSSISPAFARFIAADRAEALLLHHSGKLSVRTIEALLSRLPADRLGLVIQHLRKKAGNDWETITAVLPFLPADERRSLLGEVLNDAADEAGEYLFETVLGWRGLLGDRQGLLADFGALLNISTVERLIDATADEVTGQAVVLSVAVELRSWSTSDLLSLIRLVISRDQPRTRQQLLVNVAGTRAALLQLGGRTMLANAASAIERAGAMFP